MPQLFVVIAGNIVSDSNDAAPNAIEVFSSIEAAESFGALYDYYDVKEHTLDPVVYKQFFN
jgi:hypothetical protein